MQRVSRALVVAAALAAPSFAHANLLTNAGFETGDLSGWTTSGDVTVIACGTSATGCAPSGGAWLATLNNRVFNQDASLTQAVTVTGPGTYAFGAMVALGTTNAAGNFSQAQISLTVQGEGVSATVGQNPNALAGQFTNPGGAGFSFTDWFELSGTLVYTGVGPVSLLININVQVFVRENTLALNVDNAFLSAVAVPEPASLALLGAGLLGLGFARARRKG